jgi:RNA polymerase sigma-70 factor, ECF subfamily
VGISDVVQETNLKAFVDFQAFQGSDEGVLVAWLRQILKNFVLNLLKNQGRPGRRPESLEALLERACVEAHWALESQRSSPCAQASRREQAVLTANALESLPPDYRQVLVWRCLERASRELLARAAKALRKKLQEEP